MTQSTASPHDLSQTEPRSSPQESSPLRSTAREGVFGSMLIGGLPLLIGIDAVFGVMHLIASIGLSEDDLLLLSTDRGYSEWWDYLQAATVALCLTWLAGRSRQAVYMAWALVFSYVLLDDSLMIHETVGLMLAEWFDLSNQFNLRARDLGELMVSAMVGVPLLGWLAWSHWRSDAVARRRSRNLSWMFALLVFFGIAVDMAHIALVFAGFQVRGLGTLEDGGELVALSLAAAYAVGLLRRHFAR